MKKSNFRSFIWGLLIACSLGSFVYLKSVPVEEYQDFTAQEQLIMDEPAVEEAKTLLPDILLVKKVIDITKVLLSNG